MYAKRAIVAGGAAFIVAALPVAPMGMGAQSPPAALTGEVSSEAEGRMEGVLVTVRRQGANFTVSVPSDAQGRYSFPRTHLALGTYIVSIRAAGYDLVDPGPIEVGADKPVTANLRLQKTKDLASQLTSLEWLESWPGTTEQKDKVTDQGPSCNYCHTLERISRSKFTAEQWVRVIRRMQSYYPDGTAVSGDRGRSHPGERHLVDAMQKDPIWGSTRNVSVTELAEYLATVNLSGGKTTWPYELKTLPRPTGKSTRVIITQWDQPRKDTVSHDLDLDSEGVAWYTDESRMFVGKLDPRMNTFSEYPLPDVPKGDLPGARDILVDKQDNVWFTMRVPGGASLVTKFDRKTQKVSAVEGADGQFVALGPDGKIWTRNTRDAKGAFYRVDPSTMTIDFRLEGWKANRPPSSSGNVYQVVVDPKGNPYGTDFRGSYIVEVDASSGQARFWPTPTRTAMPRRGKMDTEGRFWFAEYGADRIGMFDTSTKQFKEWPVPVRHTNPYTASTPDARGRVYSSSNMSERLLRLDPYTGEVVEYMMPTYFDTKKIAIDPSRSRVTLWMANTRNARIVRVEPLD